MDVAAAFMPSASAATSDHRHSGVCWPQLTTTAGRGGARAEGCNGVWWGEMRHVKSSPPRVFNPVTAEMPCSWVAGLLVGGAADRPATDRLDRGGGQLLSVMNESLWGILGGRTRRASLQRHHHRRRPLRRRDCRRPQRRRRLRSCSGRRPSSPPRWPPTTTLCHVQVIPPQPSPSLLRRRRPHLMPPSCMGFCPCPRPRHALQYSGDIDPKFFLPSELFRSLKDTRSSSRSGCTRARCVSRQDSC